MLKELVIKNRSRRTFKADNVIPYEKLVEFIDIARNTPAAMNLQPLKYRIVHEKEEVASLLALTRWAGSLSVKLPPENKGPAAFIVICHDTSVAEPKPIFTIDVGICAQTIMLAATEAGYGGCIIGSAKKEAVSELLTLPSHIEPQLILGLGEPDEEVRLVKAENGQTKYYRDENNVHYVPKRPLDEIII